MANVHPRCDLERCDFRPLGLPSDVVGVAGWLLLLTAGAGLWWWKMSLTINGVGNFPYPSGSLALPASRRDHPTCGDGPAKYALPPRTLLPGLPLATAGSSRSVVKTVLQNVQDRPGALVTACGVAESAGPSGLP